MPPKISSLTTAFAELDLSFMMITETWIRNAKETERNIKDYADAESIGLVCKNRPTRGGGVCVAFDSRKCKLQRFPLPTSNFEVVCAAGKVSGFSRKLAVLVVYVPPKYTKTQVEQLREYIADGVEKIKRDLKDPYICVGGDMNNKEISEAFGDFEDIVELPNIPSRHGAPLDRCFTNFSSEIFSLTGHPPLQTLGGVASDHLVLSFNFKVQRKHHFQTSTHETRHFGEEGLLKFNGLLCATDWSVLDNLSASDMVVKFDETIKSYYDLCFPVKIIKVRDTDLPWVSKRIKRAIRRKKRKYKVQGSSTEWKEMEREVRKDINDNRVRHLEKVKKKILDGGTARGYYSTIKMLHDTEPKAKWSPNEIFPGESDQLVAEKCADFFNAISSEFNQIDCPNPDDLTQKLPPPEVYQIAGRLRCMKKKRSRIPGDIDPKVVNYCADGLAVGLHKIFAAAFETCEWPGSWKDEMVTIIPKGASPSSLSETRNISCTPLFSKLMESFLLERLRKDVKLSSTQFGGVKGLRVDHFLVETWDEVLRAVDKGGLAVNLTSIDFQKAFNRMDHATCLERLRIKGAHPHLVKMVAAFLFNRTMSVRNGSASSEKRIVNGGAPQGSILGPYLFCTATERLAETVINTDYQETQETQEGVLPDPFVNVSGDSASSPTPVVGSPGSVNSSEAEWAAVEADFNFFRPRRANELDDTILSVIPDRDDDDEILDSDPTVKAYIDDFNIIEVIPVARGTRHITTNRTKIRLFAEKSSKAFSGVSREAKAIKMLVNEKKTQLLCIDPNPSNHTSSFIQSEGVQVNSGESLKILGFIFGPKPSCRYQIDFLIAKYRTRLWSLRKFAAYGLEKSDLLAFYKVFMRPILEYTQVTYHSMITKEQSGLLERSQRRALRIIHGPTESYSSLLEENNMRRLSERREEAFRKFAKKSADNKLLNFKWFPLNYESDHITRNRNVYLEENARTEMLFKSPIFTMRRFLNSAD